MSYAPETIRALGAYWVSQGGVNLGIVGSVTHCYGYHLGEDRIFGSCACRPGGVCRAGRGWDDYSVKTARDKGALTNFAAAIDLGRLNGSLPALWAFSVWLVGEARAGAVGTEDLREIIYTPDGVNVYGWSREAGIDSAPILGYGGPSHLTHTHISFYRDSEARDKLAAFKRFFEENMLVGFKSASPPIGPGAFTLGAGHALIEMASAGSPARKLFTSWPGGSMAFIVIAGVNLTRWADGAPVDIEGNSPPLLKRNEVYLLYAPSFGGSTYALRQDGVFTATPDMTPYAQADIDQATAPLLYQITTLQAQLQAAAADKTAAVTAAVNQTKASAVPRVIVEFPA